MNKATIIEKFRRKSSQRFIPEIDALRFFAIIPVMFAHLSQAFLEFNGNFDRILIENESLLRYIFFQGNLGVELFFGISGFILTLPFINIPFKKLKFKKYFLRRIVRIEPPYFIALLIFFGVHLVLGVKSFEFLWERLVTSFFYVHNLVNGGYSYILPPAWSLEIEIQFYILMPIFLLLFKVLESRYWRYLLYAIIFWFSLNLNISPYMELSDYMRYFLSGIVAADIYKNYKLPRHFIWDIIFIICMLGFFFFIKDWALRSLSLFLIIYGSLHLKWGERIITNQWVTIIGGMCYSIYLLHYPFYYLVMKISTNYLTIPGQYELTILLQSLIFIPLSIVAMSLFYLMVEKPFMVLSQRIGKPKEYGGNS